MTDRHVRWESERFYWARIDAGALPRRPTDEQLGYLFERFVPEPVEQLQAVYVALGGTRFVGIAARRVDLKTLDPSVESLRPLSAPGFIEDGVDVGVIEFLTGDFLPVAARRARRRAWLAPVVAMLVVTAAWVAHRARHDALIGVLDLGLAAAATDAIDSGLGPASAASAVPAEIRLEAALRELRRTRRAPDMSGEQADSVQHLADVLQQWPLEHGFQIETVVVTPSQASILGLAPSAAEVQALARALEPAAARPLSSPSIRSTEAGVRFDLQVPAIVEGDAQ